jgi:hypothetical protein
MSRSLTLPIHEDAADILFHRHLSCCGLLGVFPFDLFARRVLGIRGNKLGYRRRQPVEDSVLSEVVD